MLRPVYGKEVIKVCYWNCYSFGYGCLRSRLDERQEKDSVR